MPECIQFLPMQSSMTNMKSEKLFQAFQTFQAGFEAAPIGMALLTPDLHWVRINQQFCDLLGYSHEELWNQRCDEMFNQADREQLEMFRQRMVDGKLQTAKIQTRFIRKDRSCIDVEIKSSLMTDAEGKPDYFIDIVEDITEYKKIRAAAHEIAENYRLLVENAIDHAIIRIDKSGNVVSWNPGATNIFKYEEEEIIGKSAAVFFTAEDLASDQYQLEMKMALKHGRSDDDRWQVRKDGSRFWASGVMTAVRDENGQPAGFVKILRDLTDRKLSQERALYLSQHDGLTALPNRGKFHDDLVQTIADAKQKKNKVGVLFIDLDRFKNVNDSLGHHIGDALLLSVARRLVEAIRNTDLCARLGGDEFGIICSNVSNQSEMAHMADKLISELSRPFDLHRHQVTLGASIGITLFPDDAEDSDQLLKYADMAMYHAKSQGRSTYEFYTENLDVEAKRRNAIEEELRHAIERNELSLHYQPQMSFEKNALCSVEALLRWKNQKLMPVSTEEFIALADETGLIVPIGEWVLRSACKQVRSWQQEGLPHLRIAVNVSSRQLKDDNFVKTIDQALTQNELDPDSLELEITERLLMEDNLKNISTLHALKARGIRISVDDFGTGFSSLSYLKHFPIDSLKIDKVFVKCLPEDQHDAAIASAIIGMAHSLGLQVVAEGVETENQRAFLSELGCNCGQGYLFSVPLPPEQLSQTLRDGNRLL
jgi:diguanylate cyclase (GGDEF)-like protein/PAS domain S-box-containing protein